ncbi:MAG: hypothetical protein KIT62_08685 [Cyclobacteriaceae bacterium]|nr:hypothetical protein [Cyclobacteriaceae bacterium]
MKYPTIFLRTALLFCVAAVTILSACSDDDKEPIATGSTKYVLVTMSDRANSNKPGYISAFNEIPSGNISNITATSLGGFGMGGWRTYENWIFKMFDVDAYSKAIERIAVSETGVVTVDNSILPDQSTFGSGNFVIVNETQGFYWDAASPLAIQKFNPTTLQNTGSINLASAVNERGTDEEAILFRAIGQKFLAVKNGKLFTNITYAKTNGGQKGFFDDFYEDVYIAVIDIATETYESTTVIEDTGSIAYINENEMYDFDTNGDLYVVCQGRSALGTKSKIARIRANSTAVDQGWELNFTDYNETDKGKFVGVFAKDGKLILVVNTEELTGGAAGNINTADIWKFYSVDVATKVFTEITGIPAGTNPGAAKAVVEIDGKILLRGSTNTEATNGYYELNGTVATQLFNVTAGGSVSGFYKITLP